MTAVTKLRIEWRCYDHLHLQHYVIYETAAATYSIEIAVAWIYN
jgi:hypothetical protein